MAEIVNLRMARKHKARSQKEKAAAENRVRHGMTKSERVRLKAGQDRELSAHEAHRRDDRGQADSE